MENRLSPVEKRVELSLLYDFYGELLKEHQRQIFEDYIQNDYSLAEIAEEHGVSRQGIHDTVKRCTRQLEEYEERLHLIARFQKAKEAIRRISQLTEAGSQGAGSQSGEQEGIPPEQALREIQELSRYLLELW